MEKMVSIVMAYFNRKPQLIKTLRSISLSAYRNIEIIIVDDASSKEHQIGDITNCFPLDIKLIVVDSKVKTWINSCIPFNMGLLKARGDIVIIQNPECLHYGDIITFVSNNIEENNYITMACYSISRDATEKIKNPTKEEINSVIRPLPNSKKGETGRWYNHPVFRPCAYHFMSAISKETLAHVGLFDERFANGFCYDDDEFVYRIRNKGVKTIISDPSIDIFSVHQWHEGGTYMLNNKYRGQKIKNKKLFYDICAGRK